jgi:ornithine cyclodeaminase/alanine dehydrogenase-like protein (mu-crystallin family)
MKVLARFPENPPGMNIGSLVALFDGSDGFPIAIMDAVYFTAVRTAAGGGLSAFYCARKDATSVGIVGSGVQARYNLIAMKQLLPQLSDARVYSRSEERRESFAEKMQQETGIQMVAVETVEEAVEGMEIILMGTNSPQPVLLGRLSDTDVTIFDSSGLAVQDVICAHHCYEKAKKVGKGTWVDLGLGELP